MGDFLAAEMEKAKAFTRRLSLSFRGKTNDIPNGTPRERDAEILHLYQARAVLAHLASRPGELQNTPDLFVTIQGRAHILDLLLEMKQTSSPDEAMEVAQSKLVGLAVSRVCSRRASFFFLHARACF